MNKEPDVNDIWDSGKESLRTHSTRQDMWRDWYKTLSLVEMVEYHIKELPADFITKNNCHVQSLIELKGVEYVKNKWGML